MDLVLGGQERMVDSVQCLWDCSMEVLGDVFVVWMRDLMYGGSGLLLINCMIWWLVDGS